MSHFSNLLGALPFQAGVVTRQISAENPTGEKGRACLGEPNPEDPFLSHSGPASDLGIGWKVRPFIRVGAGERVTLADIRGPGCINQIWFTSNLPEFRSLVLRFFWDNEESPSVEVPAGDLFGVGHDSAPHLLNSLPIVVGPFRGCNCYWQMPFRERAVLTLENQGPKPAENVAYKVIYKLHPIPSDAAYFHTQWRRSLTQREHPEHTIVDGIQGRGIYVGTYLAWSSFSSGWWGEGEVKFFIDGDTHFPTIADNGTEDYFGGAWCFERNPHATVRDPREQEFSTPFLGLPLARTDDPQGPRRYSLYRWHVLDSVGFASDLRVTVQALGWWPGRKYEPLTDDIASVAYWYQEEPHAPFPALAPVNQRWSR